MLDMTSAEVRKLAEEYLDKIMANAVDRRSSPPASKANSQGSVSSAIPSEHRTKAITLRKAAALLGKPEPSSGTKWLKQCIEDGTISCEKISRQSYVFDLREFPANTHHQLRQVTPTQANSR